jgi:hypothetical protein
MYLPAYPMAEAMHESVSVPCCGDNLSGGGISRPAA